MDLNAGQKGASVYTQRLHDKLLKEMDSERAAIEKEDVENYKRHIIYELGDEDIKNNLGEVWPRSMQKKLTDQDYPDTVNPYLWDNYVNGYAAGVVKFADGFYTVSGLDSSPIGFVKSEHGWIIQDCARTVPAAEIAINALEKAIGENVRNNIRAIIYSHTHNDHLGGVAAFLTPEETGSIEEHKIPIIAPAEFEQSLVDDNLYAGIAMSRRLMYQCGLYLEHNEKGRVSIGLASTLGVRGRTSSIMPTWLIEEDSTVEVDGVKMSFILAPNTETRAHMCTYFENYKVLFMGDVGVGTIHNIYTMRGAPVRDANYWGKVFYKLYRLYGEKAVAVYQGHGIPHFKMEHRPDNLKKYLLDNAVAYKYTHDQALLLANEGYSIDDIGRRLEVPESISKTWYTRGHYGSYSFNARGTIQKYLGFYDGNPVNLLPLDKRELAQKLVSYMGCEELVLEKAKEDFEKGEYQWVATITQHLIYLNPFNKDARYLCADAFEQLGYQTDNALWRNAYLAAALDLRHPKVAEHLNIKAMSNDEVIPYVSDDLLLDHLGVNFDGFAAGDEAVQFILKSFIDASKVRYHSVKLYKGTILHEEVQDAAEIGQAQKDGKLFELSRDDLYLFATKSLPDEKVKNLPQELLTIYRYVVDTSQYKNFHLVEPIEQLR